jgi:RNA polymerase sigma factor (sigma-70 family)
MIEGMDTDAELVASFLGGDQAAFAAIYDRYADRLHDFASSILRDRDEAADATHDTFLIAAKRLDQLREPSKLRAWLYAVARHEALRRARALGRVQATEAADLETVSPEPSPEASVDRAETIATVWDAAAGLSARDQALLDLHVRQGLQGQALGDAMGISAHHADVLMSRLRDQVQRSIGALLVARQGRRDCPDLQVVLADWDGRFTPLWRKRVARHVDDCKQCSRQRATFLQPLAALAAVGIVPAPIALRARTLGDVGLVAAGSAADAPASWRGKGRGDGFPPSAYRAARARRVPRVLAASVAAVLVVAIVVIVFLVAGSGTTNEPPPPATAVFSGPGPAVAPTSNPNPGGARSPTPVTGPRPTTPTTKPPSSTAGTTTPSTRPSID